MTKDGTWEAIDYSNANVTTRAKDYERVRKGYLLMVAETNAKIDALKKELASYGAILDDAKAKFEDARDSHNSIYGHNMRDAA